MPYFHGILDMLQSYTLATPRQTHGLLTGRCGPTAASGAPLRRVSGLTRSDTEDLLDWLESQDACGQVFLSEVGMGFTFEYQSNG